MGADDAEGAWSLAIAAARKAAAAAPRFVHERRAGQQQARRLAQTELVQQAAVQQRGAVLEAVRLVDDQVLPAELAQRRRGVSRQGIDA